MTAQPTDVPVTITVTETTRYTRHGRMPVAELRRLQALVAADGGQDEDALRDVADYATTHMLPNEADNCEDLRLTVSVRQVPDADGGLQLVPAREPRQPNAAILVALAKAVLDPSIFASEVSANVRDMARIGLGMPPAEVPLMPLCQRTEPAFSPLEA